MPETRGELIGDAINRIGAPGNRVLEMIAATFGSKVVVIDESPTPATPTTEITKEIPS